MHPEIDRYAGLESPIHRWDPGLKIIGFCFYLAALATLSQPWSVGLGLVCSLALVKLARISLRDVVGRLAWIVVCLIPFFLLLPLGWETAEGFRLTWSMERARFAGTLVLRALAIAVAFFPMWGTAPLHQSVQSLGEFGVPRSWLQLFLSCYRYLFVYLDQIRKLRIAAAARSFRPRCNLHTLRTYGNQLGMLIVTSYEQTERILMAMKSRGYRGEIHTLHETRRVPIDWIKFAAAIITATCLIAGDRWSATGTGA